MNNMKINIPKGFEIDKENSSLETGDIVFKEVEKKYPTEFKTKIENIHHGIGVSLKYGNKLQILNVLLCLRDEYNRIDGFEGYFRFGRTNWCISNINNTLYFDSWDRNNKLMNFGKKETAELFFNTFKEQLERVKEFL